MPRQAPDNSKALAAFIAAKSDIDRMLEQLLRLSAEHFNTTPEAVTWSQVGSLQDIRASLQEITDRAFREGEYAA